MIIPKDLRGSNKLKGKNWNEETLKLINDLYNQGYSHQKIGELTNIDHGNIRYILKTKLKIETDKRDLRKSRSKGIGTKKIVMIEENMCFNSISEASSKLNISRSNIILSLKTGKQVNKKYTFKYL
jgi:predicted DNA-binding protein YlxM (UPF0122 family)